MVDRGDGHRFTYNWQVPSDSSGAGHYISITTSVYTDSGYTTKAENYADVYSIYLVQERMNPILAGGGGGADIDYKRVRKIVEEVVSAKVADIPKPEPVELPNINLQPVLNTLSGLRNDIQAIDIPKVDLSGVEYRLELLQRAIESIPETNLSPITDEVKAQKQTLLGELRTLNDEVKKYKTAVAIDINKVSDEVKGFERKFENVPVVVFKNEQQTIKQPVEEPIDYRALLAHR